MPDIALVVDREGRILYSNREAPGRSLEGTSLFNHELGADAEARVRAALHQVFERAKPISYKVDAPGADEADPIWYLSRWSPIERGGEVVAALVVSSDITTRVKLEQDLERLSHVGSWEWDPGTGAVTWSDELYEIYGVDPRTFVPTYESFLDLVHPDDREFVATTTSQAYQRGEPFSIDERIIRPDGTERVLLSSARVERRSDGSIDRVVGICLDITERKLAEQQLERVSRAQDVILASAAEGILGLDTDGCVTFANPAAAELLGWDAADLRGQEVHEVVHGGHGASTHAADRCPLRSAPSAGGTQYMEDDVFWRQDGSTLPVQYTSSPIIDRGEVSGAVLTFNDTTERKRFEAQLQYLADHDPVTGLFNRRRFEQELTRHLSYAEHHGSGGAVLALDLDMFKYVNDTLGHKAGDEVIGRVARNIRERLDETLALARLGGDEFAVLVPQAGIEKGQAVARAILDAVRSQAVTVGGQEMRVTASVGITTFGARREVTAEELLVEADLAMYDAKSAGRDQFALYTPMAVREAQIETRLAWADRVRRALDEGRLTLCSQPVFSVSSGEIVQHELLVRVVEDGELVLPATFMPSAERFGLMPAIDRWVATGAVKLLSEVDNGLRVEINVSGESAAGSEVPDALAQALEETGVDPSRVIVEMSESAAVANIDIAQRFARRIKELGCQFAIDDFGAGFGSFYFLKQLPFDYLKIHGSFIHSLPASRTDQLVVQALVNIARGLGRRTAAEFVGDDDTLAMLADLGVDLAQGYHLARPVPADELLRAR
jgi:diguanylate cyclase (GGDEF)-like protein/PAS domain S-box-containing protein